MPLPGGMRLGPYEILSAAGSGGMGEVYLARDTRLGRMVAIKVLPSSGEPLPAEARARFEREARLISRLNHPHICTLHDVGREGEHDYLVMEHIEGESLAARLSRGSLPLAEALGRADEILDALDAAHRGGVVHRDLKPGNVMITSSGAKVLDFGLARAHEERALPDETAVTAAPTATAPLTARGRIVGTPPYMAPEHVQGHAVDARADLFSFGALFFEMLTGRRAFEGSSAVGIVAAVLERDPPAVSSLRPDLPPALDAIVRRCLAKDPDARWQTARDLRFALGAVPREPAAAQTGEPARAEQEAEARRAGQRQRVIWAILVAGFAITLGLLAVAQRQGPSSARPVHLSLPLPAGKFFPQVEAYSLLAVSPDGTRIAYVGVDLGIRRLYVRRLDERASRELPGTEGALSPFWSPDGRFIGYLDQGARLMRIEATGGPPRLIHEIRVEGDAEWEDDGTILFSSGLQGIQRIPAEGGTPAEVTRTDPSREVLHVWPRRLPDGRHMLYLSVGKDPAGRAVRTLYARDLTTGAEGPVPEVSSRVAYADGRLLYVQDGSLLARAFDPATRRFTGDPVLMAEQLSNVQGTGLAEFAVGSGTLAYHAGRLLARLVQLGRHGELRETGEPAPFSQIRRSPDGRRLAATLEDPRTGNHDLWIYDAFTGLGSRLSSDPSDEQDPVWSPDGQWIYYRSDVEGPPALYVRRADGTGPEKKLLSKDWAIAPLDVSPDGRELLYLEYSREHGGTDLWILNLADSSVRPFLCTPSAEHSARISPNGRWVVFVSDESGDRQIYVAPYASGEARRRLSSSGGVMARWRPDGRELLFATPDVTLMSMTTDPASGEPVGSARVLMRRDLRKLWGEFEPGPDGESIMAIRQILDPRDEPIEVILDWQTMARR